MSWDCEARACPVLHSPVESSGVRSARYGHCANGRRALVLH